MVRVAAFVFNLLVHSYDVAFQSVSSFLDERPLITSQANERRVLGNRAAIILVRSLFFTVVEERY